MTFIDTGFILFLLAGVCLFYIFPVKARWVCLLIISIAFYAIAGVEYIPFILLTTFSVYLGGLAIGKRYQKLNADLKADGLERSEKKALKAAAKAKAKRAMLLVLIFNLAILCVVKFTKFLVDPINGLISFMGGDGTFSAAWIIVPLGISYYTFSTLSYLLDVYWKRIDCEKNYFRFLLYAIYFPHILQGPIERYSRLGQRLKQELRFNAEQAVSGLQLMAWGYFKKLVIADRIDIFITDVYSNYKETAGILCILCFFLDIAYIYADFSGCMDIARGASALFGVEMDLNFNHPFSSKSVTEFWRRWHMSLGGWFREYVYYPLSTSTLVKNIGRKYKNKLSPTMLRVAVSAIPVSVTWVLTGVWHGTGKTYVAWGIYYAFMILTSVCFSDHLHAIAVKMKINTTCKSYEWFQMFRTTCIFGLGRLLTRPGSLYRSWYIFRHSLTTFDLWTLTDGSLFDHGLDSFNWVIAIIALLIWGVVSHLEQRGTVSVRSLLRKQNFAFRWLVYLSLVFAIIIFGVYGPEFSASSFVYMEY